MEHTKMETLGQPAEPLSPKISQTSPIPAGLRFKAFKSLHPSVFGPLTVILTVIASLVDRVQDAALPS